MLTQLQNDFREVMAGVATPVSVVTAFHEGAPHGTTVSAFTSLSMTPPMVLVSLDKTSRLLGLVRRSGRFGVNILGAAQAETARSFAKKLEMGEKFAGITWEHDTGLPRIAGVPGWLACSVTQEVEGGDHIVLFGEVLSAAPATAAPLTYHSRTFGTHSLLDDRLCGQSA
ncbi:flavin reductase family protein [Amycolatopsis rhabdoformis]|uniref:Flavin reductase family protein n=1 Tax=Amycolatopsis rhabdoformis TaxID=1448059 RepID=A0ABZ1IIT3_9PSEU|nr:flavin reductase family protein [Amycolatopsis rhabdoformis]WSE34162.1 flavin reductase family protein [Amycolatopsis rhabdoformis]